MIIQNADQQIVKTYTVTADIKFENGDSSMQTFRVAGAFPAHAIVRAYEQMADYAQSTHPGQDRRIVVMLRKADESDHAGRAFELRALLDRVSDNGTRHNDEREFFYVVREDGRAVRQGRVNAIDRTHAFQQAMVLRYREDGVFDSDVEVSEDKPFSRNPHFNFFIA